MAKEKNVKCKVVRAFLIEGKIIPVMDGKKQNIITLPYNFAREMQNNLKVEIVGAAGDADTEPDETDPGTGDGNKNEE